MPASYLKAMLYLSAGGDSVSIKVIKNEQYGKGLTNATNEDNIHPLLRAHEKEGFPAVLRLLEKIKSDVNHADWVSLYLNTSPYFPGNVPLVALYGHPNRLARIQTIDELIVFVSLKQMEKDKSTKHLQHAMPAQEEKAGRRCIII